MVDNKQLKLIKKIERMSGKKIESKREIDYDTVGYKVEGENIIELGLYNF
ncbi:MAG: hypothetical protein ACTSR3_07915 [Candidatus Helarchaeota archaeon]